MFGNSDNRANSVKLLLQLPTGTELGKREKERLNDVNNNGQATHGARKYAWRTQVRMAHASRLGQFSIDLTWTLLVLAPFLHTHTNKVMAITVYKLRVLIMLICSWINFKI